MRITICGSMKFADLMEKFKADLERFGHEVKLPVLLVKDENGKPMSIRDYWEKNGGKEFDGSHTLWDKKMEAIKEHYKKVEWSEAILVVNLENKGVKNYIGGNTLLEMGLAFYLNKKIFLLNPVPDLPYKEEILGMKPIVLNGVLDTIQQ